MQTTVAKNTPHLQDSDGSAQQNRQAWKIAKKVRYFCLRELGLFRRRSFGSIAGIKQQAKHLPLGARQDAFHLFGKLFQGFDKTAVWK